MMPLFVIAGLTALVGYAALLRHGGVTAGLLAVLVAGTVFGYPFFHRDVGPLPLTLDRVLLAALLCAVPVWLRSADGLHSVWRRIDTAMVLFMVALGGSVLLAAREGSPIEAASHFLFFYGLPCVAYFLARSAPLSEGRMRAILAVLGMLGVYLAVTAVLETIGGGAFVWPRFIAEARFEEFLGRARGPLLSPIGNGIFLVTCAAAMLPFMGTRHRARTLLVVGLLGLVGAALFLTKTRSVWLGAVTIVMLLPFAFIPWRLATAWAAMLLASAGVATALEWNRLVAFKRDQDVSETAMRESARLRPILATIAYKMFLDQPLVGVGLSRYSEAARPYLGDRTVDLPLEKARPYIQHNVFLSLLVETGLIGVSLFILLLAFGLWDAWHVVRTTLPGSPAHALGAVSLVVLIVYVVNGMFHEVAVIAMCNFLLFSLWGWTGSVLDARYVSESQGVLRCPPRVPVANASPSL